MRKLVNKQIGPYKTLTLEGQLSGPCVVLLHGFGADAADLVPLAEMMGLPKEVTWIFPEGPTQAIIGPGLYGRAWFQIDSRRLEAAMMSGEPFDMSESVPEGLTMAVQGMQKFYKEIKKKFNKIILGGFSQGAMLATEFFLTQDNKPDGLVIMSGTLINKKAWIEALPSCAGLSFIQSHGKNDVILGYEFAENLYSLISDAGMFGDFIGFNGGHEIPPKVIEKIGAYIKYELRGS